MYHFVVAAPSSGWMLAPLICLLVPPALRVQGAPVCGSDLTERRPYRDHLHAWEPPQVPCLQDLQPIRGVQALTV